MKRVNLSVMKNRTVVILVIGKTISMLGSNIQQFALSLYVYITTGSATMFGIMLAISILPRLVFSPIAGVFGDWFDRKKMIVRLDFINALTLALFTGLFLMNQSLAIYQIFILIILLEITELFYESASAGIVPSIVQKEEIIHVKSLMSMTLNFARLLSPVMGAFLYGTFGLLIVLIINTISFLIAAIAERFMRVPAKHQRPQSITVQAFFNDLKEGLTTIQSHPMLKSVIGLGVIINFIIGPLFSVGFIVIIMDIFQSSEFQYGLFQSILAASMIIGPLFVVSLNKRFTLASILFYGLFIVALMVMAMAIVPSQTFTGQFQSLIVPFTILIAFTFIIGLTISIINVSIGTMIATTVSPFVIGRVSTVLSLLVTLTIPIGQITYGVLFDSFNIPLIIIGSGTALLLSVLLFKKNLLKIQVKDPQPVEAPAYDILN